MASFFSETGFDFRTLDLSEFASPIAVAQFTPAIQSGLPFDIYTKGLYGIEGGTRAVLAGDLDLSGTAVSGDAFLFAKQSTDQSGNWLTDFQVTDTAINAFSVHFMLDIANPSYVQALFMGLFGGNDTIELSSFNDAFDASFGDDVMFGRDGNDLLRGNFGNDRLEGGNGRDRLEGGYGRDTLLGDRGSDQLVGGRGADDLIGGGGNDKFIYLTRNEGHDTIWDFRDGDAIAFKGSTFGNLAKGELDPSIFVSHAADNLAEDGNDRFIYNEAARELWFDSNGDGDGGLHLIARFNGFITLTAEDLAII